MPTEEDLEEPQSTSLLEEASRFLEDPTIRDAPLEKKVAFLESKGVKADEIETLLGVAKQEHTIAELEEVAERAWPTASKQHAVQQLQFYAVMAAHQKHMTDNPRHL